MSPLIEIDAHIIEHGREVPVTAWGRCQRSPVDNSVVCEIMDVAGERHTYTPEEYAPHADAIRTRMICEFIARSLRANTTDAWGGDDFPRGAA